MSDKTEAPTPHRIAEAREKGDIAKSMEINAALALLASFWLLRGTATGVAQTMGDLMKSTFTQLPAGELTMDAVGSMGFGVGWKALLSFAPFVLGLLAVGVVANVVQTGGLFVPGLAAPNLQRLNPIAGLQRIFSRRGVVEMGKALLKVLLVGWVVYGVLKDQMPRLLGISGTDLHAGVAMLADAAFGLGARAALAYLMLAAADYRYQRQQWTNKLKMSRQDVIDEAKRTEGDPLLRARIRQQQRRMARQRMMDKVPKANVVIINPTHLAVALAYDRSKMSAPKVVAKGAMRIAERIVEIARANGVPVIQNIPLARALFAGVQIDQEIPPALYQAAAEVLAFVFSLRKKSGVRSQNSEVRNQQSAVRVQNTGAGS